MGDLHALILRSTVPASAAISRRKRGEPAPTIWRKQRITCLEGGPPSREEFDCAIPAEGEQCGGCVPGTARSGRRILPIAHLALRANCVPGGVCTAYSALLNRTAETLRHLASNGAGQPNNFSSPLLELHCPACKVRWITEDQAIASIINRTSESAELDKLALSALCLPHLPAGTTAHEKRVGSQVPLAEYWHWDHAINVVLSPLTRVLGLPIAVGTTLVFGLLRKGLSMILLVQALGNTQIRQLMTASQILVFTIFITFYIPCIATVATLLKQIGLKMTAFAIAYSFLVATALGVATRFVSAIVLGN